MKIECAHCGRELKVDHKFHTNIERMIATLQRIQRKGWEIVVDEPSYEWNWNMGFICSKCKVKGNVHARIHS
jgi:hypothetical protein